VKFVKPLSDEQRQELEWVWREGATHRERTRAHAVLLSAQGRTLAELAEILGAERDAVGRWLSHWEQGGVAALADAPRTGRPRRLLAEAEAALVAAAQANPASPRAELAKRGSQPSSPPARVGRP
jgi:transposase